MKKGEMKALVFLAVMLLLAGCGGPKKVKLYESTSDIRNNIIQTAISLHGNPYKSGAKGSDAFDCSGFVHYVYKKSGIAVPVSTDALIKTGSEIPRDQVQPGDLVFFKIKKDLHIGIMINRKEFIHASKSRGIALDDVDAAYWKRSFTGFRTVLG
jgi:cell wall-associated NlpC family hydrolase